MRRRKRCETALTFESHVRPITTGFGRAQLRLFLLGVEFDQYLTLLHGGAGLKGDLRDYARQIGADGNAVDRPQ